MIKRIAILLILLIAPFIVSAENEVTMLPGLPPDSIVETGVKVWMHGQSVSPQKPFSCELSVQAFRLDHDFKIFGVSFYSGAFKKSSPTIEPFTLIIPHEATADTAVVMDIKLDFPELHRFQRNDTMSLDTSEGRIVAYTGSCLPSHFYGGTKQRSFFNRYRPWIISAVGIMSISIMALLFSVYARRMERIRRDNMAVKEELGIIKQHSDELNNRIDSLYGERLATLNRICNEYFEKKDAESESIRLSIYNEVERIVLSFRSREALKEIENTVNTYCNNILIRLREQVPSLSDTDLLTVTYLYAGFSPKAVCIFTDSKIKTFYNRRLRLREKIVASGAPDTDEFLSRLG